MYLQFIFAKTHRMNQFKTPVYLLLGFLLISFHSLAQNSDVNMQRIIQEKRVYNLNNLEVIGYKIQLFNGISETTAKKIQSNFSALFPDIPVRLFFEQPEWKVQAGNFLTKLEAHKALQQIQKEFAGAFPLKAKIKIE